MLVKSFLLVVTTILLLASSCVHNKIVTKEEIKVAPVWISDTLAKTNYTFRKVNRFSPLIYKNSLIVANSIDGVSNFDTEKKSLQWRLDIKDGVESSGIIFQNNLFFGSLSGVFYSVNADTGKVNWTFDTKNEIISEPLIYNGIVYFLNGSNILFSLDAATGKQLWVYNRQETTVGMTVRGGSRPLFSDGLIYLGFSDGSFVAIKANTGSPQWEVLLNKSSRFKDIDSNPVLDGDSIYINSYDDKLYSLSKSNGSILWTAEYGGATSPLIFGDKLIYSSTEGYLVCLNKKSGALVWKKPIEQGIATEPILHKGLVVVGLSAGPIIFVDALTGDLKTSFDPGRGIMSKITSDKANMVYFISGEANLYGLKIENVKKSAIPYLLQ